MKKTLRVLTLAAVVALSSWATNLEATEPTKTTPDLQFFQALQGLTPVLASENLDDICREEYDACKAGCSPTDSLCFQECQCWFAMCRGWVCN
jgi:hypothetical protein